MVFCCRMDRQGYTNWYMDSYNLGEYSRKRRSVMRKHHHGIVIRESRERQGMTQAQLAAIWPKDDGGVGVSVGFVQLVEAGKKSIESERTKRGLCDILHVEPWRFGLADYDPENPAWVPQEKRLLDQTLEFAEYAIKRFEDSYRTAPLPKIGRAH